MTAQMLGELLYTEDCTRFFLQQVFSLLNTFMVTLSSILRLVKRSVTDLQFAASYLQNRSEKDLEQLSWQSFALRKAQHHREYF